MDEITLKLNSPITEEQWDDITDVDFDSTDRIWFHTKHGKGVEFVKQRKGKWIYGESEEGNDGYFCDQCGNFVPWIYKEFDMDFIKEFHFCHNCGARMSVY